MLIGIIKLLGREAVIEYSPEASWKSWGHAREGRWDNFIFLGKISLVHTNHWQQKCSCLTKVVAVGLTLVGATSAASALGVDVAGGIIEFANRWGPPTGPHPR